jgi:hypothetical protein
MTLRIVSVSSALFLCLASALVSAPAHAVVYGGNPHLDLDIS